MARMSEAAPSPAARRWFHAGRMLAEAEMEVASTERTEGRLTGSTEAETESTASREELRRLVDELSPEDAAVVLALVRRLRAGR